jgi:hypothetical protein
MERGMERMKATLVVLSALTLVVAMMTGCEILSTDEGDSGSTPEISEFGDFTTHDETPGFGDADLLSGYPEGQPFEDDMDNHPDVRNGRRDRGARHYALRIIWGNIETRDSIRASTQECPVSDWSGSIEVEGGVAIIRRLILFDPGDHIVRPRRGPGIIQWSSHTMGHVDGLLLTIIDVTDSQATETPNTLTLTTPFYSGEIPLADLEDYREFVVYDECNSISIVATRIEPLGCPKGFMEGRWIAETDTSGYFKGVWIGNLGTLMGHLRGIYEVREGERVLFGKWISTSGEFQGLLRGTWAPLDNDRGPDGVFDGRWFDENIESKGFFRGHYAICPGDSVGFFHGRWAEECR